MLSDSWAWLYTCFVIYELFSKKNHNNFVVTQEFIGWQKNNYAAPEAGLMGYSNIINNTQQFLLRPTGIAYVVIFQ